MESNSNTYAESNSKNYSLTLSQGAKTPPTVHAESNSNTYAESNSNHCSLTVSRRSPYLYISLIIIY